MANHSKTENALRNAVIGITNNVVVLVLHLLSRKLFLRYLGIEYLSVEQVARSLLSILSFSEMGIGSAVLYMLYKPVAEGDRKKITQIVNTFRRLNTAIGLVIIGLGVCCLPFLHLFITTSVPMGEVYMIFLLRLAYSAISYFCAHRQMLINADQKNRVISMVNLVVNLAGVAMQCVALAVTKSYVPFALVLVATTVVQNLALYVIGGRMYPYLKEDRHSRIDRESGKSLITYVKSLFAVKVGGIIINNTDNILVSAIDTLTVGYMANYSTVTVRLQELLTIFHNSILYSLGIASVEKGAEEKYQLFRKVVLIDQYVVGVICVCTGVLWHDFISVWLGKEYVISDALMYSVLLNFMWRVQVTPLAMFRDTNGLFVYVRRMVLINAGLNIVLSLAFGRVIGVPGVYIATVIADILTDFWFDARLLYEKLFRRKGFWKYDLVAFGTCCANLVVVYLLRRALDGLGASLPMWAVKGTVAALVYTLVYVLVCGRTQVFRDVLNQIVLPRLRRKKAAQ